MEKILSVLNDINRQSYWGFLNKKQNFRLYFTNKIQRLILPNVSHVTLSTKMKIFIPDIVPKCNEINSIKKYNFKRRWWHRTHIDDWVWRAGFSCIWWGDGCPKTPPWLDYQQLNEDSVLSIPGLEIYPNRRKIYRGRKEISFTVKEYDLFYLLVVHQGHVLTDACFTLRCERGWILFWTEHWTKIYIAVV